MATVKTTTTSRRRIKNVPTGVDINKPLYAHDLRDIEIKNLSVVGNLTLGDAAADTLAVNATITGATPLVFEGATADTFETSFAITDPTADRTITFQDLDGTVMTYSSAGATILPGSAVGTPALTMTAGDLAVTDGDITLVDSRGVILGTSSDFELNWDGTFLQAVTIGAQAIWAGAPSPADPSYDSIVHEFKEDFLELDDDWTVTEDSGAATQAVGDANFGVVTLTNAATSDDDGSQIQYAQETFQMISGKEIWFEARVRCAAGDATNLDFFVGLAEAEDLTGVADNMPANGFGFHKDDGDTNVDLSTSDGGTNVQQATVHTLVDNTWVRLGLHFDGGATGSGTITPYIDGVAGTAITTAAYATMAEVSPLFMIRNGDGTTTQTLEVDYVKVVQVR